MAGEAPDPEAATAAYEQAATAAAEQNAKLLELRAVSGLAIHQGRTVGEVTALASGGGAVRLVRPGLAAARHRAGTPAAQRPGYAVMSSAPSVTIAGGGVSGLTAALRLAERGYQVKLYEQKSWLGGNLGSRQTDDGEYLDVYPHMYLEWYHNFWALLEDVTKQRREERFESFSTVRQLAKGTFPKFASLTDMYSPWHLLHEPVLRRGTTR